MKYVVYSRPAVSDEHYDEYIWERDRGPYDDRSTARENMPGSDAPISKEYNYTVVPFEDDEEIEYSLDDSEKRSRQRNNR